MSIDLEAIRRRADAATPWPWGEGGATVYDEQLIPICRCMATRDRYKDERQNADFIAHAREDIPALLAEVKRQAAEIAAVTAERDAAANAVARMAEYIVTLGGVDYHLCDDIPQEHHLKFQPKNDGDYDNEPCIECVKAYFMSGAGKEQNDG